MPQNLYKIQYSLNSTPVYVLADSLIEAIKIYTYKMKATKDPEVVEWLADQILSN